MNILYLIMQWKFLQEFLRAPWNSFRPFGDVAPVPAGTVPVEPAPVIVPSTSEATKKPARKPRTKKVKV